VTVSLEQVEFKIAFLEKANADLSDVVYRQQQEIDALRARIADLAGRFESAQTSPTQYTAEEEKPPHY
jgi:SlyX protein